MVGENTLT